MANWLRTSPHTIKDHIDVSKELPAEGYVLTFDNGQFRFRPSNALKVFEVTTNQVDFSQGNYAIINATSDQVYEIINLKPGRFYIEVRQIGTGGHNIQFTFNGSLMVNDNQNEISSVADTVTICELFYNNDSLLFRTSQPFVPKGWKYSQDITYRNDDTNDVLEIVQRIEFDNTNFDFSKVSYDDGRDIVITDADNNIIPFWIEYFSKSEEKLIIWFYIQDRISPGDKATFRIWYNNPVAEGYSDPTQVFTFFDDFTTWSGWLQRGSGNVYQDLERFDFPTLRKDNNNDPNGGYKYLPTTLNSNHLRLIAKTYRFDFTGGSADRIGVYDVNGNGYGVVYTHDQSNNSYLAIDVRNSWSASIQAKVYVTGDPLLYRWYYQVLSLYGHEDSQYPDMVKSEIYDENYTQIESTKINDNTYNSFDVVAVLGGHDYHVEWMGVYRFNDYYTIDIFDVVEHDPRVLL